MAHFYGGVQGQAGEATRMGSQRSGMRSYIQTWTARIQTSLWHASDGTDCATVTFTGGPSSSDVSSRSISIDDVNMFVKALSCGDPVIDRKWDKVVELIGQIEAEAEERCKRAEEQQDRDRRKAEKEQRRKERARDQWVNSDDGKQVFTAFYEKVEKIVREMRQPDEDGHGLSGPTGWGEAKELAPELEKACAGHLTRYEAREKLWDMATEVNDAIDRNQFVG